MIRREEDRWECGGKRERGNDNDSNQCWALTALTVCMMGWVSSNSSERPGVERITGTKPTPPPTQQTNRVQYRYFYPPTFGSLAQDRLQCFNLAVDHLQCRTSDRPPFLHTRLKVEHIVDILSELFAQPLVILQAQLVQLTFPRLCECDRPPRYVVRFAERDLPSMLINLSASGTGSDGTHPFAN